MTKEEIRALVKGLGSIREVLGSADPADQAEIYRQLGLGLTYEPGKRTVRVASRGHRDRSGRGEGAGAGAAVVRDPEQAVQSTAMAPAATSAPGRRRIMRANSVVNCPGPHRGMIRYRPYQ
jgi:hypothetical protein